VGAYHRLEGVLQQINTFDDPSVEVDYYCIYLVAIKRRNNQKEKVSSKEKLHTRAKV